MVILMNALCEFKEEVYLEAVGYICQVIFSWLLVLLSSNHVRTRFLPDRINFSFMIEGIEGWYWIHLCFPDLISVLVTIIISSILCYKRTKFKDYFFSENRLARMFKALGSIPRKVVCLWALICGQGFGY
jgi:hypothetical protein